MTLTTFNKLAILDTYGFRFSTRGMFRTVAPQADRECFATIPGAFAIWEEGSDVDGWAVVGDNADELVEITFDTLELSESAISFHLVV